MHFMDNEYRSLADRASEWVDYWIARLEENKNTDQADFCLMALNNARKDEDYFKKRGI